MHYIGTKGQTYEQVERKFLQIPTGTTELWLDLNTDFHSKTRAELAALFSGIPASVTSLDLTNNYLGYIPVAKLARVLSRIPTSVTSLRLDKNMLDNQAGVELKQIFSAIPASVTNLHIGNNLYRKTAAELVEAFSGIGASVTNLDLSQNYLGSRPIAELKQIFSAIPASVTRLNLFLNNLGNRVLEDWTGAELAEAFSDLPASVTNLILSGNHLVHQQMRAVLAKVLSGLPASVTQIYIEDIANEKHPVNYLLADYMLETIFPSNMREAYYSALFSLDSIEPIFSINEQAIITLIKRFQASQTPTSFLVCGLLLDGTIRSTVDEEKNKDSRMLAAIAFYRKAARDATLKPSIEMRLCRTSATSDSPVVQHELKKYDLPSAEAFIPSYNKFAQDNASDKGEGLLELVDYSNASVPGLSDFLGEAELAKGDDLLGYVGHSSSEDLRPTNHLQGVRHTLDNAENSIAPVPGISEGESSFISLNPCLIFGLFSSVTIGAVIIALLWLSAPTLVAIIGTVTVSVTAVATYRFFHAARRNAIINPSTVTHIAGSVQPSL